MSRNDVHRQRTIAFPVRIFQNPGMKKPAQLTGSQRRQLRALAHHLQPLVQVGAKGITDEVRAAVDQALTDHELIKVKIMENAPIGRRETTTSLADPLDAHEVGVVGRIVILYRRHPETPRVPLR